MDNKAPEINSNQEPQIPEQWKFRERFWKDYEVIQIDPKERLLSLVLPVHLNKYRTREAYSDYLFDSGGQPEAERSYAHGLTRVALGRDSKQFYQLMDTADYTYSGEFSTSVFFMSDEDHNRYMAGTKDQNFDPQSSDNCGYNNSMLNHMVLSPVFGVDKNGSVIQSPKPIFHIKLGQVLLKDSTIMQKPWGKEFEGWEFQLSQKQGVVTEIVVGRNGKTEFKLELKSDQGEFVLSQIHIPTGAIKTLKAPLSIDTQAVQDAVCVRAPYEKDSRGRLIIPWTNLPKIIPASISRSQVEPPKSEN